MAAPQAGLALLCVFGVIKLVEIVFPEGVSEFLFGWLKDRVEAAAQRYAPERVRPYCKTYKTLKREAVEAARDAAKKEAEAAAVERQAAALRAQQARHDAAIAALQTTHAGVVERKEARIRILLDASQQAKAEAQVQALKLQEAVKSKAAAEQRAQSLQAQVDALTKELQATRAHQREQAAALEQQTVTLQDTQARLKISEQALSGAKQQVLAGAKAEHQRLQLQLRQARREIAELEEQRENATRDINKKTAQLDGAQQQLAEATAENQRLSWQIDAPSSSQRHFQPADSASPAAVASGAAAAAAVTTPPPPPPASPQRLSVVSPPPASAAPPPPPPVPVVAPPAAMAAPDSKTAMPLPSTTPTPKVAAPPAAREPQTLTSQDTQAPSITEQSASAAVAGATATLPPPITAAASTATLRCKTYRLAPSIMDAAATADAKKARFAKAIKDMNAAIIGNKKDYFAAYFHLVSARNNFVDTAAGKSGLKLFKARKAEFATIEAIDDQLVALIINLNKRGSSEHYKMVHCFAHLPVPLAPAHLTALKDVGAVSWLNLYDVAIDMFSQEAITLTAFSCVHAVAAACFADADDALAKALISQFEGRFAEVEAILKRRKLLALPATTTLPPPPPPPTAPAASSVSVTTTTTTMPPPAPPAPPVAAASAAPKRAGATTTSTTTTGALSPAAASAGAAGSRDALFGAIRAGQVSLRSIENTPPPVTPISQNAGAQSAAPADISAKTFAKMGNMLEQAKAIDARLAQEMQSRRQAVNGSDASDSDDGFSDSDDAAAHAASALQVS